MTNYLEPTNPEAFIDYPGKQSKPDYIPNSCECPKCKGYGGWNLKLNAYPLHFKEDTPQNRHLYSHFRAGCSHCFGWGWVREEDADHVHDWQFVHNIQNCLNLYDCSICGKQIEIDSSD